MKKYFKHLSMAAVAAFAFAACEEVPELPYQPGGDDNDSTKVETTVKTLPYEESFSSSLGDWTSQTTSGEGAWINDYNTAKATGYDNASKVTTAGTYYLVSPEISLEGVAEAHVAFEYILRYNKGDENQQMLISADYTDDAATATWAVLSSKHTEGTDWVNFEKADINIPAEYMGKLIRIAFYYNTNDKSGSTWEVRNFAIAEGKATEKEPEDDNQGGNDEPVNPSGSNLVGNGDFEVWNGSTPTNWQTTTTAGNASLSQSSDAHTGSYAVQVGGSTSANKRLGYQEITLTAGTYHVQFYTKAATADGGSARPGYTPVGEDGKVGQYVYGDYVNDLTTDTWTEVNYEFTLSEQTTINLVVMCAKNPGAPILVDDYSLTTTDGALVEGGNEGGEDTPDTPADTKTIAEVLAAGNGAAKVKATIVATYARGFLLNDGTGYILTYLGEDKGYVAGDVVTVSGDVTTYGGLLQFPNSSVVEKVGTAKVTHPEVTVWGGADMDKYLEGPSVQYIQYTGTLSISGYYYNVTVDGAETAVGSIAYPAEGLVDPSLDGQKIVVTGYAIGFSGSKYVNTMALSVAAAN